MSSGPKDEGGRARRRRRRGGAPASRPDAESTANRPPRRSPQQSHQSQHHQQAHDNTSAALGKPPGPIQHQNSRNPRDYERRQRPNIGDRVQPPQGGSPDQGKRSVAETQAKIAEQKRLEEEATKERERLEKEEKEREERKRQLAEQRARREQERSLNLSYRPAKVGDAPRKERLSDTELRRLDSSLKKCTGFLRKLRFSGITDESVSALCQEAESLNLSRYISEVVSAISESKLRSADVESILTLCGHLYRRYEDFTPQLVPALTGVVLNPPGNGTSRELSSRRAAVRLLIELFVLGMSADVGPVTAVLKQLVRGVKDVKEEALNILTIVASFVRSGAVTILPLKTQAEANSDANASELKPWEDAVLPLSTKLTIQGALQAYYDNEVKRLLESAVQELQKARLTVSRSKNARGDPDDAATSSFETAKSFHDKLISSAKVLAEAVERPSPESVPSSSHASNSNEDSNCGPDSSQVLVANPLNSFGKQRSDQDPDIQVDHPFESEEERSFYTDLPFSKENSPKRLPRGKPREGSSEIPEQEGVGKEHSNGKASSHPVRDSGARVDSKQAGSMKNEGRKRGSEKHLSVDKVVSRLSSVESRESVDSFVALYVEAAEGSKNAPKRLAKSLVSVSAQKLNLLPAYSRIAASLFPLNSDIAISVATSLEDEFRFLVGKSDIDEKNLAVSVKTAKYIGEYVKFGLIGPATMFDLLGLCMKDFSAHRVDIACHLLETCGRFVYRTPSTHMRMGNILETLWRLKSVKNLEARHNALVESAFYASRPSSANKLQKQKSRPVLHEYIRHLIYYRLDASNIKWTQNQLLKLPWDEKLEQYVIKKFVKISRARFSTIPYVSTLIAALQKYKPALGIGIVDALLESIRSGMEKNDGRESQRRIAEIQLLGELYKCGVVNERIVYNVLYQSITLGHDNSETHPARPRKITAASITKAESSPSRSSNGMFTNAPDPPGDFFRIRIVCVLIEACGRVLVASNRRKLEVFWTFFERYIFCKTYQAGLGDRLPLHINHVVGDAFEHVLQKERRTVRDPRNLPWKELEFSGKASTKRGDSWHGGSTRAFCRCTSLEDSLEAVQKVEQSATDASLICVPVRQIGETAQKQWDARGSSIERKHNDTMNARAGPPSSPPHPVHWNSLGLVDGQEDGDDSSEDNGIVEEEDNEDRDGIDSEDQGHHDFDSNEATGDANESLSLEGSEDLKEYCYDDEIADTAADEDEDAEEESDDDEDDDDYDDVVLSVEVTRPKTEEEDAFAKELAAFTAAAVQSARTSSSKVTKFDRMTIPMALMTKKMEEERAAAAAAAAADIDRNSSSEEDVVDSRRRKKRSPHVNSVEFKMLLRKGGKSQLQDLQVPSSSSLALAAKENESADAARHEETKRLVLGSTTVLNHDEEDLDDEVPLRTQQNVRAKEESIRQQRSADEMELLSTLYRTKPRR